MPEAGWYRPDDEPEIERWWDGEKWTDAKREPPEGAPDSPPPEASAAPQNGGSNEASRPWYKKKRYVIPGVLLTLFVIAGIAGGGAEDEPVASDNGSGEQEQEVLFPDRADRQPDDIEAQVGETIAVGGYSATVTALEFTESISDFEDEGYLVADVELTNNSDEAQSYNTFDWRLQTANGQVLDPAIVGQEQLGSGDLVEGGNVTGQLYFEVGQGISGDYYVIYKPGAFDAARGIWGKSF